MTLKTLTLKTLMLLLLTSLQRGQTMLALRVDMLELRNDVAIFRLQKLLKHNRTGDPLDMVSLRGYPKDPRVCSVYTLKKYLDHTEHLCNGETQLFGSYVKTQKKMY